jgi:hypothetical protein
MLILSIFQKKQEIFCLIAKMPALDNLLKLCARGNMYFSNNCSCYLNDWKKRINNLIVWLLYLYVYLATIKNIKKTCYFMIFIIYLPILKNTKR